MTSYLAFFTTLYRTREKSEVPAIVLVSRHWNIVVNVNVHASQRIWYNICAVQNPEILRIYDLCSESKTCLNIGGGGYKRLLCRTATSSYKPRKANHQLQRSLELVFRNEGIVGFTNVDPYVKRAYNDCEDFIWRVPGINTFTFYLNGGIAPGEYRHDRYLGPLRSSDEPDIPSGTNIVWVSYDDLGYIIENWETECQIIRRWCAVVGITECTIEKPVSQCRAIRVLFKDVINLEEEESWYSDDSDEENFDY